MEKSVAQTESAGSSAFREFMKPSVIHVVIEIITLMGLILYIQHQNKNLKKQINELTARVDDQDEIIQRHEEVLQKIVQRFQNGSSVSASVPSGIATQKKVDPTAAAKAHAHALAQAQASALAQAQFQSQSQSQADAQAAVLAQSQAAQEQADILAHQQALAQQQDNSNSPLVNSTEKATAAGKSQNKTHARSAVFAMPSMPMMDLFSMLTKSDSSTNDNAGPSIVEMGEDDDRLDYEIQAEIAELH
jgi:hypothetical protein